MSLFISINVSILLLLLCFTLFGGGELVIDISAASVLVLC